MVYVTAIDGARRAGLAEKTVRNWIQAGLIKAEKRGRAWRISLEELERLKAERTIDDPRDVEIAFLREQLVQARQEIFELRQEITAGKHSRTRAAASDAPRKSSAESKVKVSEWLAEHGAAKDTARRWPELPVTDRVAAFRYAQKYYTLHTCDTQGCVCHGLVKESGDQV